MSPLKKIENEIKHVFVDTPIGKLDVAAEAGAVVSISVCSPENENNFLDAVDDPTLKLAAKELTDYFKNERKTFTFPVHFEGTAFQHKVWEALLTIPYGETKSYGDIAAMVDLPKGARAVGMACNRNPVMIAVPCHRIVGKSGSLTGFAYGTDMKQTLLNLEKTSN